MPLFDLSGIDMTARRLDRNGIAGINPHRGTMALLDHIVWCSDDFKLGVGLKQVRDTEFWVDGHFPGDPFLPGVLLVEAAAQLATFLKLSRGDGARRMVFTRIEDLTFRAPVRPGDELYLLCAELKNSRRYFVSGVQGMVGGRVVMTGQICGAVA